MRRVKKFRVAGDEAAAAADTDVAVDPGKQPAVTGGAAPEKAPAGPGSAGLLGGDQFLDGKLKLAGATFFSGPELPLTAEIPPPAFLMNAT